MVRVDRATFKKDMESDMRQFGDQVTSWKDTHSQVTDEAEPLLDRWRSLGRRLEMAGEIPDKEWDAFVLEMNRDFTSLRSDYQRASSKYDVRH